jgi:hypothetical protein
MKTLSNIDFPEQHSEAEAWKPTVLRYAFAMHVLAVATTRVEGTWKAYCDAVDGMDHDVEQSGVLHTGAVLAERIAREVFPQFAEIPYAE